MLHLPLLIHTTAGSHDDDVIHEASFSARQSCLGMNLYIKVSARRLQRESVVKNHPLYKFLCLQTTNLRPNSIFLHHPKMFKSITTWVLLAFVAVQAVPTPVVESIDLNVRAIAPRAVQSGLANFDRLNSSASGINDIGYYGGLRWNGICTMKTQLATLQSMLT